MDDSHVIEVVLGMGLLALLVHKIVSGHFILSSQRLAVLMSLKGFTAGYGIFLIYPERLNAFVNSITLHEWPGFEVCQHSQMLRNCRKIDFFFERDQVVAEVAFMVKCFGDERLTLSSRIPRL